MAFSALKNGRGLAGRLPECVSKLAYEIATARFLQLYCAFLKHAHVTLALVHIPRDRAGSAPLQAKGRFELAARSSRLLHTENAIAVCRSQP
jgi:hypothetical protein